VGGYCFACAARATASDKARTRFQCLCSEKRGDTSAAAGLDGKINAR
jgi:hypothetical protein